MLLTIFATLSCEDVEEDGDSSQRDPSKDLTKLSAEELSKLTNARRAAFGDDYANMDLREYDAALAAHGTVYKRMLLERIMASDKITITEHSDRMDFRDEAGNLVEDPPFYEYRTVLLTKAQRSAFVSAVGAMEENTELATSMCIFEPHHRIEFISDHGETSTMSICFKCGQVRWNELDLVHPEGLFGALQHLTKVVGFEVDRDWRSLAKQQIEQVGNGDAEESF